MSMRIAGLALCVAGIIAILSLSWQGDNPPPQAHITHAPSSIRTVEHRLNGENAYLEDERNTIAIFEQHAPSVVYIESVQISRSRDFWSFNEMQQRQAGAGTGFIWDAHGHIVTNFHVIYRGNQFRVTLANQEIYEAKVVGLAPSKDLAVLKIEAKGKSLTPIRIGSSQHLRVGSKVLAIGNPFGLDQSLSVGVISALGRQIESLTGRTIRGVVQTDAAINPGNSGGPLLNSRGEMIGVNTQILSKSGESAGIGFAVPVDTVRNVVPQLISFGKIMKPGLGIEVMPDGFTHRRGVKGVMIRSVDPKGVAYKAGLYGFRRDKLGRILIGDVILGINDLPIASTDDLGHALESFKVGDTVKVKILRHGKIAVVKATLRALE